jgi:hypothetical protein
VPFSGWHAEYQLLNVGSEMPKIVQIGECRSMNEKCLLMFKFLESQVTVDPSKQIPRLQRRFSSPFPNEHFQQPRCFTVLRTVYFRTSHTNYMGPSCSSSRGLWTSTFVPVMSTFDSTLLLVPNRSSGIGLGLENGLYRRPTLIYC